MAAFLDGECIQTWERTQAELFEDVRALLYARTVDHWVMEEFRLYEDKAAVQTGSTMGTCECIGVVKYLLRRAGVEPVMQPANIQEGTAKILRAKRVVSFAKKNRAQMAHGGNHAFSAELHGQYFIRRSLEGAK